MHISNFFQLKIAYIYTMYFSVIFRFMFKRAQWTFHECPNNKFYVVSKSHTLKLHFIPSIFKMRGYENPQYKF